MRCVRRAYLCGVDKYTGQNYDHRRECISDKIKQLGAIYCIDVCVYAVMSNHFYVVLHINQDQAALLTCMVYVELNPIRAGMCITPELSSFTGIQ